MEDHKISSNRVIELYKSAENWTDIRQQLININYYNNNQWIRWNVNQRTVERLPPDNHLRLTINKIRPRVGALLSKHVKTRVKFDVIPASKEEKDIDASKAADKYMHYMWEELKLSEKTAEMFLYALVQKRTWVKTWYDATAGDDISPTEEDGTIYEDWVENGGNPINKGEICVRVCDPLTIYFDPAARTEDELRWVIERRAIDIDEIMETYDVEDIVPDANIGYLAQYDMNNVDSNPVNKFKHMAMVTELWWKPCKKHPNGLKVTVCNERTIDYDDNAGEIPFNLFGYIPTPGVLWHDAIVTDLLDPQRELNVVRSMLANQARKMGNPIWSLPIDSIVDEDDLNNDIGGIIRYNPNVGAKPERIGAPDVPSYYSLMLQQIQLDIDDMSGSREISQGSLPAGLDTAAGLELMVEQENEKLSVASQAYERCMKKVLQRVLQLIKEHYTEERQARILGEGNEIELIRFNGSDLTGSEDINIMQGSSLPELRSAEQGRITSMWTSGAIVTKDGQPDAAKYLRLMGMGDSSELFEQEQMDSNNAKLENEEFTTTFENPEFDAILSQYMEDMQRAMVYQQNGVNIEITPLPGIPEVWTSDDHEIHLNDHNTFRKGSTYRKWAKEKRDLFDQHMAKHEEMLQAPIIAQQQQMMEQQQAQEQAQQQAALSQDQQQFQQKQAESQMKFDQTVSLKQLDQQAQLEKTQLQEEGKLAQAVLKGQA